jgi:hypothetical protein
MTQIEMEFLSEYPQNPKNKAIMSMRDYEELISEEGNIVPLAAVPELVSVTRQRVYNLIRNGTLRRVTICKCNFLFINDLRRKWPKSFEGKSQN